MPEKATGLSHVIYVPDPLKRTPSLHIDERHAPVLLFRLLFVEVDPMNPVPRSPALGAQSPQQNQPRSDTRREQSSGIFVEFRLTDPNIYSDIARWVVAHR